MNIEKERLTSLIEFAQQLTRLRSKPAATVASHDIFSLFEHQLHELPGITLNSDSPESEDEIWLSVERLHMIEPPVIDNPSLAPWVNMTRTPFDIPRLRESIQFSSVYPPIERVSKNYDEELSDGATDDHPERMFLSEYEKSSDIRAFFNVYIINNWRPWADDEKLRRKTINLYAKLFTLKQQLEGGIAESQIELAWGVGIGVWRYNDTTVSYPLITRLVELVLNPDTAAMELRPREIDTRLELDWYASVDNPGVVELEKGAKEFFASQETTFSPFDSATFEPILRLAVANLDANGEYWPDQTRPEDRNVPKPDDRLKVTNTWVLFARPRSNSVFLHDLENLKKKADEAEEFPPAVAALVTDPDTENPEPNLPVFRGVSATGIDSESGKASDLFFPKPFNDEQVRIIQLLEVSDTVVVQGPPGTGKTHTIANVICHYLASGKRVLVTSMKDPALAVLRHQLPDEIKPLAISLLSSEQEGMKQFEHSINKIASEVQSLDRSATHRAISEIEQNINILHSRIAGVDRKIKEWAKISLSKIILDDEDIDPLDAAKEVVQYQNEENPIPDRLGIGSEFAPPLSDSDLVRLRNARRTLGEDIRYLGASMPQITEFPDPKTMLEVHQDLVTFEKLKRGIDNGETPQLADSSQVTIALAQQILDGISFLQNLRNQIQDSGSKWATEMRNRLRLGAVDEYLTMLEGVGKELSDAVETRREFIKRPVIAPIGMEKDSEFLDAIDNLISGKKPFGLLGIFGKSEQKKKLDEIRVLGSAPNDTDSWRHVSDFLALQNRLRELAVRWNALAGEVPVDILPGDSPDDGVSAADQYALYLKLKDLVKAEKNLVQGASQVFPTWEHVKEITDNEQYFAEFSQALKHHLLKNRLSNVWAHKERFQRILDRRSGRIINDIRSFLADSLGCQEVSDAALQTQWSDLMAELSRLHGLSGHLALVCNLTDLLEGAGAPGYASMLRAPLMSTIDSLLPDDWRQEWRLRRLSTHLSEIDSQEHLKKLGQERSKLTNDLARSYQDIVVKRTWLKLAENASPSIRSALQAYLAAIQKIGKGSGKRAVRYRHDAQIAASHANPAIPCWIMAHYRVSESLPAELGCFDLVIIDEASQSDFSALPAVLRAKKALIVGDDKQVSPEGVGLEEEKVVSLMNRFLSSQVPIYKNQMSPERSIYDLFKVVFAKSTVMLKEHFRCVGPIIEYSKREFYNHELKPLRLPKSSERLDPPLIDVLVKDGYRSVDLNLQEAQFIVNEIKAITQDPAMSKRSIGVVSLLADKQAAKIWEMLTQELDTETIERHRIACGDARTFQGKERDIMFLSMVSAPNNIGAPLVRDTFAQRFNVAASRARDRMYLVRSVEIDDLSNADKYRRSLIGHFNAPFSQDETRVEDLKTLCESDFEREVYEELTQRGFSVTPQVKVGAYRIDMVVEGENDARLAVECDGDKYHGPEKWVEDMNRQRILERAGWVFWRCFASEFVRRRHELIDDLLQTLSEMNISPISSDGATPTIHVERRVITGETEAQSDEDPGFTAHTLFDEDIEQDQIPYDQSDTLPVLEQTNLPEVQGRDTSIESFTTYESYQVLDILGDKSEFYDPKAAKDIRRIIEEVVEIEGPVSLDVVARRVVACWDIKKIGSIVEQRIARIAATADVARNKTYGHTFLWPKDIESSTYHSFRIPGPDEGSKRVADELPPEEIANAALYVLKNEGDMPVDEVIVKTARMFGYGRTGPTVSASIKNGIEILKKRDDVSEIDGLVVKNNTRL